MENEIITIGGKKYRLVPIDEEPRSLVDEYAPPTTPTLPITPQTPGVRKAEPKVFDYRERYKNKEVYQDEIKVPHKVMKHLPKLDHELDKFTYKGESLFFGEGLEEEL